MRRSNIFYYFDTTSALYQRREYPYIKERFYHNGRPPRHRYNMFFESPPGEQHMYPMHERVYSVYIPIKVKGFEITFLEMPNNCMRSLLEQCTGVLTLTFYTYSSEGNVYGKMVRRCYLEEWKPCFIPLSNPGEQFRLHGYISFWKEV
jgi:hypothetical protein